MAVSAMSAFAALAIWSGLVDGDAGFLRVPVTKSVLGEARASMRLRATPETGMTMAGDEGAMAEHLILRDFRNIAYHGEIRVGTPGEALQVMFDTGSADVWVPTNESSKTPNFDPGRSSTHQALATPFFLMYVSGPVFGRLGKDALAIGGLSISNFTLGLASNVSEVKFFNLMPFSGIVGLGLPALSGMAGARPVMDALVESGQLAEPVFGFYLGDMELGQLTIGGVDPRHFVGDFYFLDVVGQGFWAVPLQDIKVGSSANSTLVVQRPAIIDSGTSFLAGPPEDIGAIARMLGATLEGRSYALPCHRPLPSISFTLGAKEFALEGQDLIVSRHAGSRCAIGLQIVNLFTPSWILGDIFMRKYYVQFDWAKRRVGLARAAPASAGQRSASAANLV